MANRYNIYKLKIGSLNKLVRKVTNEGLIKQKTIQNGDYQLTFYFSENVEGNDVWWYTAYKDFFKEGIEEPQNYFYFGLLIIEKVSDKNIVYAVSLGKSHFYLNKFIVNHFGINVATRIADGTTTVLKKSRLFSGTKRQEISSYIAFQLDNYDAGESVEHIKLRATDESVWGDKSIVFADSIQFDYDEDPLDIVSIISEIETVLGQDPILELPKLEIVNNTELIGKLDLSLVEMLKGNDPSVTIEEFTSYGVNICFNYTNYNYKIYHYNDRKHEHKVDLDQSLTTDSIKGFFTKLDKQFSIDDIRIQFSDDTTSKFTKPLKELLDFHVVFEGENYFLKNGEWFLFNETFKEYLYKSLTKIKFEKDGYLSEKEYITWKKEKSKKIKDPSYIGDKLVYREYYFNFLKSENEGYILLDRQNESVTSLNKGARDYKVEVADLYKDNILWAVKIGKKNTEAIYNIAQSLTSIELIKKGNIEFDKTIDSCGLWFVLDEDIKSIDEINSIQVLLSIESWKKKIESFGLIPIIRISQRIDID